MVVVGLYSPGPGMGKTTVANYMCEKYGFTKLSFATALKQMGNALVEYVGEDPERLATNPDLKDNYIIPGLGITLRRLYQTIGTEWGRETIDPNIWLNLTFQRAKMFDKVVIDDMRFKNEMDAVLIDYKGSTMHIYRPRKACDDVLNHASEGSLSNEPHTYHVYNKGSLSELYDSIDIIMQLRGAPWNRTKLAR